MIIVVYLIIQEIMIKIIKVEDRIDVLEKENEKNLNFINM